MGSYMVKGNRGVTKDSVQFGTGVPAKYVLFLVIFHVDTPRYAR